MAHSSAQQSLSVGTDDVWVDRQAFRDGMSRLATAVNIITTMDGDRPFGFTASAVASVTDTPPTLLVCVNRDSQSYPVLRASGVLCVNTLASQHEELGMLFAGRTKDMEVRFAAAGWTAGASNAPVLADAVVSFDCRIDSIVSAGTHEILLCGVLAVHHGSGEDALVYYNRKFSGLPLN